MILELLQITFHFRLLLKKEEEISEGGKPTAVGFIINKNLKAWITEIERTLDRMALVVINKKYSMKIIREYT